MNAEHLPNLQNITAVEPARYRRPVPDCWQLIERTPQKDAWQEDGGLLVICSRDRMFRGCWWLHVSASRPNRIPSWDDLRRVKDEFIGRNEVAVQMLPADRDYVNLCPNCLHLWSPDDE